MKTILDTILQRKKIEVQKMDFFSKVPKNKKNINKLIDSFCPFYISEYKRKSPLTGTNNIEIPINKQINRYIQAGTSAISILTDKYFFGGTYKDLKTAVNITKNTNILILQKDFIIDKKQIQKARILGADLILLIARILDPTCLIELKNYAESLGMSVLLELHEYEEFIPIQNEKFNLVGINNRDLNTFNIFLNRFNVIANQLPSSLNLISESGIKNPIDIRISKSRANGFLIGRSLMTKLKNQSLYSFFQYFKNYFFKSCGLQNFSNLSLINSDLIGVNFSPISKRKITKKNLLKFKYDSRLVAVFKKNSFEEIQQTVIKFKFSYVQIYIEDFNLEQIKKISCKKILAFNPENEQELNKALGMAKFIDFFILDGITPGSGEVINLNKCYNFPYPFLLAGGIKYSNLGRILKLKNCIGVDIASGIITNGDIDPIKVNTISKLLNLDYSL